MLLLLALYKPYKYAYTRYFSLVACALLGARCKLRTQIGIYVPAAYIAGCFDYVCNAFVSAIWNMLRLCHGARVHGTECACVWVHSFFGASLAVQWETEPFEHISDLKHTWQQGPRTILHFSDKCLGTVLLKLVGSHDIFRFSLWSHSNFLFTICSSRPHTHRHMEHQTWCS